jgi:two-component system, cell cycle sensor histidine kinase and response regulator CckA
MTLFRSAEEKHVIRIVFLYAVAGSLWILLSDRVVAALITDPVRLTQLQTVKGWFFVLASSLLLYALVRSSLASLARSRMKLRENAERFRATFEQAAVGMAHVAPDGRWLRVNQRLCEITGYTRRELFGLRFQDITHPDDLDADVEQGKRLWSGQIPSYSMEKRYIRKDGSIVCVNLTVSVACDASGDAEYFISVVEDINDRKRRQEELTLLATAVEHAGEGVIITDAAGAIQYVNPAFEEMTGYGRDELLGKNPRMLNSGKQDAAFYRRMWAGLLAGNSWRGRLVNVRKDGRNYTQETVITPVRSGGGDITHLVGIFGDVTEQIRLEEQFRQAQKMDAIGRLAGGIAHDFNNMLTVVNGHAQLALEGLSDTDPLYDDLQEICGAADRATKLTRQLLTFSRQQVHAPEVLELGEVIDDAKRMLARLIGEHVELQVSLAPDLGRVLVDRTQIEQVLTNLVLNGSQAMPEGGRVLIEARNEELDEDFTHRFAYPVRPGEYVRLSISDTGVGMDRETLERIFEPFFTTKERDQGTGLGLSTVYGIVKHAGGYIWVYSEPGQGSTFKIYLPRTYSEPEPPSERPPETDDYTGSETVLVAEDQPSVRSLVRRGLVRAGYRVLEAASGTAAIRLFEAENGAIDLLLTDVVMPQMGGRELAAELRARRPDLRVLFMSGYAEHEIARRGVLEPGMFFLEKPFGPQGLQRMVREVLDRPAPAS